MMTRRRQADKIAQQLRWFLDHRDYAQTLDELHAAAEHAAREGFILSLSIDPDTSKDTMIQIIQNAVKQTFPDRRYDMQRLFWSCWLQDRWERMYAPDKAR